MTASDAGTKGKLVVEAEKFRDKEQEESRKASANIYTKIMHKVVAEGTNFIAKEMERVKKLMDGKVSDAKKKQLQERLNILKSFERQKTKDEL